MIKQTVTSFALASMLAVAAFAQENSDSKAADIIIPDTNTTNSDGWVYNIGPYVWLPSMSGQIGVGGIVSDVDMSTSDILDDLEFGGFLAFNAQKGNWGYYIDIAYLKLGMEETIGGRSPISDIESDLEQLSLEAVVYYEAHKTDETSIQLYGGLTYTYLDIDMKLTNALGGKTGNGGTEDWIDPVIGVKIRHDLNDKWYLTLGAEIGGFGVSSDLLWQAMGGAGYNINDCWSIVGGYRHLYIDYEDGDFLYDTDTGGIMIGGVYTF